MFGGARGSARAGWPFGGDEMRRRQFLSVMIAPALSLMRGASAAPRRSSSKNNLRPLNNADQSSWNALDQRVNVLTETDIIPTGGPFSMVILEAGPADNDKFCESLFSAFPYDSNEALAYSPVNANFQKIYWLDSRSSDLVKPFDDRNAPSQFDRRELVDNFSFERARAFAGAFELFRSAGPWMLSAYPEHERSVLLDFSGYPTERFGEALVSWKHDVLGNDVFWNERDSRHWALVSIFSFFPKERKEGTIQVQIGDELYRYHSTSLRRQK
jgi:hypothetical protein